MLGNVVHSLCLDSDNLEYASAEVCNQLSPIVVISKLTLVNSSLPTQHGGILPQVVWKFARCRWVTSEC